MEGQLEVIDTLGADSARLVHMMPAEIWKLVCDKLLKESPCDLENLANSSPFFRNLQKFQRPTYLFEKVFPLVATKVWKTEGLKQLPFTQVLKYRKVCSQWNDAVEELIRFDFQNLVKGSNLTKLTNIGFTFKSRTVFTNYKLRSRSFKKSVHKFLRNFEHTHPRSGSNGRSPFIWDDISVEVFTQDELDEVEDWKAFSEGITMMLSKYGIHIRGFTLKVDSYKFFENPSWLRNWLSLMPNLKNLRVLNLPEDSEWDFETHLEQYFEDKPFPQLKFLENVQVTNLPILVINPLIRRNNLVTKLSVNIPDDEYDIFDIFTFPMPNLKELKMDFCPLHIADKLALPMVRWPLESLELEVDSLNDCSALPQVIRNKFSDTLSSFSLEYMSKIKKGSILKDFKNLRMDLPKLRNITIQSHAKNWALEPMKNIF